MEGLGSLVIDNGSGSIKAGFAGDDSPRSVFPTTLATAKGRTNRYIGQEVAYFLFFYSQIKALENISFS